MTAFVIESPHTPEECLQALEEISAKGQDILDKFVWGCSQGEHTGYAYIEAKDKDEAIAIIPEFLRAKAKVTGVNKFTSEQIRAFHK